MKLKFWQAFCESSKKSDVAEQNFTEKKYFKEKSFENTEQTL